MKKQLLNVMQRYRHFHTKKWTVLTHFVGVPLVSFSVLLIFGWVDLTIPGFVSLSLAWIGVIILAIYYLYLDLLLGAATAVLLIVLCALASIFTTQGPSALSGKLFLITFILGWIFQLIGHAIEGKKPALLSNFFDSVFIAPFFIVAEICFMLGMKKDLQNALEENNNEQD
jgi:uncharacterized membrane protein YGL010W